MKDKPGVVVLNLDQDYARKLGEIMAEARVFQKTAMMRLLIDERFVAVTGRQK